jgi:YggT family protein
MDFICLALMIYMVMIIVRIVMTYFPLDPDGLMATIAGFLFVVTDPVLSPLRRLLPPIRIGTMALDISPIVVIIGIQIVLGVIC